VLNELKYIYECPLGITRFDKYFDYLKNVEQQMPPLLASFALDKERYVLRSNATLHDAWLSKFSLENRYTECEIIESIATLDLLHSSHEFVLQLVYADVVKIEFSVGFQVTSPHPVDLLVHEFTILEPGVFQHLIHFDKEEWISIGFKRFSYTTTGTGADTA
jgi:hypothetical protein